MRASASHSMKTDGITVRTLTDGGQTAAEIAALLAGFLRKGNRSLDVAAYDFHLRPETAAVVGDAIRGAAARGVRVRLLYNVDHPNPVPVPPPPEPDAQLIASLGVPAHAVAGVPDLMHHKYVVRDEADVLTGSTNWTDESWSRQENVIALVASRAVADRFARNFAELWEDGNVELSGRVDPVPADVGGTPVRAWFSPGYGDALSHRIGKRIGRAR